jgi:hypothetical protein
MDRNRNTPLNPWQELEEQAYHAYREWPLFLKLRLRQLRTHLPANLFTDFMPKSSSPPQEETGGDDLALLKAYGLVVPDNPTPSANEAERSDA